MLEIVFIFPCATSLDVIGIYSSFHYDYNIFRCPEELESIRCIFLLSDPSKQATSTTCHCIFTKNFVFLSNRHAKWKKNDRKCKKRVHIFADMTGYGILFAVQQPTEGFTLFKISVSVDLLERHHNHHHHHHHQYFGF